MTFRRFDTPPAKISDWGRLVGAWSDDDLVRELPRALASKDDRSRAIVAEGKVRGIIDE